MAIEQISGKRTIHAGDIREEGADALLVKAKDQ